MSAIIHIGFHKCASTFLQKRIFENLEFNYQDLSGMQFSSGGQTFTSGIRFVQSQDRFDASLFSQKLTGDEKRPLLISHEELSGSPLGYSTVDPYVVAENLRRSFPDAKILAVIRNQLDYILSVYCFRVAVRGHEWRTLDRFLREDGETGLYEHIEYHRIISAYAELFGQENVHILPIELLNRDEERSMAFLGDLLNTRLRPPGKSERVNKSPRNKTTVAIMRNMNFMFHRTMLAALRLKGAPPEEYDPRKTIIFPFARQRLRYYRLQKRLNAALPALPGGDYGPDDIPNAQALRRRFGKSNRALEQVGVHAGDLRQLGYAFG